MKKNNTKSNVYRQGDVLFVPVDSIPAGLKPTKSVILAFGEVTGHSHTISHGAQGFAKESGEGSLTLSDYIAVNELIAEVMHQEHETITLPKGNYKITRQVEYTPAALRNVAD